MTADSTTGITGEDARRAARNAGALVAASLVSKGAQFLWQIVLAPVIGPSDYGIYGTVGALFAISASVASFSMSLIVIRDVAREPQKAGKYLTATLFSQTVLALLAYIGVNLATNGVAFEEAIRGYVAFAGMSLFIDIFGNMAYDQLLAQERMITTSLVEIGHIAARVGLAALALFAGYGLLGVYVATLLTGIGRAVVLWMALWKSGVHPQWPLDRSIWRLLLVNSAPLALSAFLSLAYSHADKIMASSMIGTTDTGYLTAAFVIIFGVIEMLSTTVLVATFPMMSRYFGTPTFIFMIEKLTFFTAVISLPLTLLLSLFAADITVPLFGEAYRPTAAVLSVLIWYALVTMVANVFAQGMMVQNRQRRLLIIRATGLGINLTLNLILLPRIGVMGAPIATVCAEGIVLMLMVRAYRNDGLDWRRMAPRLTMLVGLGVMAALVMLLLRSVHPLVGMVGGGALYVAGMLFAPVLGTDDWDLLYRLLAAIPGGNRLLRFWHRDVTLNW